MLIWQRTRTNPWIGMTIGVAASALLFAACADESPVRNTRTAKPAAPVRDARAVPAGGADEVQHASHAVVPQAPLRSNVPVPADTPVATGTPVVEAAATAPPAPPTAMEVADAWKEGVALYDGGDYSGAIVPLQIAADGLPDEPYTQYLFGLALWKVGEFESAERALSASADLNPDSIKTWINLARVRLDNDDALGALKAAETALAIESESADALHQRGRALAALQRNDEAMETLERAHQVDPDNGYVANTLGYLLLQSDRAAEALPYLEAARDRLPQIAYVRNNLGVAYERSGDLARAVDEYRAAVEAGDSGGKALASIGRLEPLVETIATGPENEDSPTVMEESVDEETITANVSGDDQTADSATTQASMEIEPSGN